ncbi:MATE family efflux transporter [Metabacillus sp. GX 13764]|uniref:MATE family efflux transporter n=1 Tax=Metabacillus kandeliae TaxID=2900151 RepID=UPI001E50BC3D|nr:MATE family efflux transporter [Metabacillus kandeliae]MCD7033515.1 MATE family efflux transporter [Metabacillus kandeliae]
MIQTSSASQKIRQFLAILLPILITQLGLYSMTFMDTAMSGHVTQTDLAGVAIGSSLWVPVYTGLSGILLAITPIVSQLAGGGKHHKAGFSVLQGVYLAAFLAIAVTIIGGILLNPVLSALHLEQGAENTARNYLIALSAGILPLFIYNILRGFIDSLGQTRVSMFITLTAVPVNLLLNYLFIFGNFGFPRLGGAGAGAASAITYWIIAIIALLIITKSDPFRGFGVFSRLHAISLAKWKELLKIGVPIGMAIFFETSIFAAVTLFMSRFDTVTIASHQAAMNFASFLYMLPLSISMALTIVVGFETGAKRPDHARQYAMIGIQTAVLFSVLTAAVIFFFREGIAGLYSTNGKVLALTQHFLLYAIFFQLSDAIAAPIQGALRGYKDVNFTFFTALISYWVIGLPTGWLLAAFTGIGAFGFWIGLIAGLAAGAAGLSFRLRFIQRRTVRDIPSAQS